MSIIYNDAGKTALADGVAISSTNNNGGGNSLLTLTGTGIVKRATTDLPPYDTATYEIAAQTATASYLQFTPGAYTATVGANFGVWFWLASIPTASIQFVRIGASGANYIGLNNAGKLFTTVTNTVTFTSTITLALNKWYWISQGISSANSLTGVFRYGLYDVRGVLLDSYTTTSSDTTATTTSSGVFGKQSSAGNTGIMRFTGAQGSNNGNALIPPVINRGRGWILS